METLLSKGTRTAASLQELQTVTIADMIKHISADQLSVVTSNLGKDYLQVQNSKTQERFSIGVGKKVTLSSEGDAIIPELINNYTVYAGETDNGVWFTFGPKPTPNAPVAKMTVAQLLASGKNTVGAQAGADKI